MGQQSNLPLNGSNIHTVYIAGPMSGIEDYNFPAFFKVQRRWEKAGHTVWNPAAQPGEKEVIKQSPEDVQAMFPQLIRRDIHLILKCTGLVILPGWAHSKGARFEVHLATVLNLPIFRHQDTTCQFPVEDITYAVMA
jgi:hypothetical protein